MVNEAMAAAGELAGKGISAEVVKLGVLCPNDFSLCLASLKKTGRLLIAEEVCAAGCVGTRIVAAAAMNGVALKGVRLLNLGSGIVGHGKVSELMREKNIDAAGLCDAATALCAATVEEK